MAAPPADRMQVVVLWMALLAKAGIVVPAPGAPIAIAAAGGLGTLSFSICNCDHRLTYWRNFTIYSPC